MPTKHTMEKPSNMEVGTNRSTLLFYAWIGRFSRKATILYTAVLMIRLTDTDSRRERCKDLADYDEQAFPRCGAGENRP